MKVALRVLAIIVPVAAGLGFILIANYGQPRPTGAPPRSAGSPTQILTLVVAVLLVELVAGIICGVLMRSRWALLIAPAGLAVGSIAGLALSGSLYAADASYYVELILILIVGLSIASLPATATAALGVWLGGRLFGQPKLQRTAPLTPWQPT